MGSVVLEGPLSGSRNTQPSVVGGQNYTDPQIDAYKQAGYTWDPVKLAWGPASKSVNSTNSLMSQLTGSLSGATGGGAGGGISASSYPVNQSGGAPNTLTMPDTSAADAAGLATAKDKVGKNSSAALRGMREAMGARGMLGSGAEAEATANVASAGQGEMADTIRQQTQANSDRTQRTAELNYQGGIQQRGQDIQAASAAAQRNQTVLLGLLQALGPMGGSGQSY